MTQRVTNLLFESCQFLIAICAIPDHFGTGQLMNVIFTKDLTLSVMLYTCEDVHVACVTYDIVEICRFLFEVGPKVYIQFNTSSR